ncbi:MAG: AAA family ATPase [Pseudomonadota bacterium]
MTQGSDNPLVAELESGAPFGVAADEVTRVDSHSAHVFLVGERAFKVKRPVAFSFLDFTTEPQRRAALAAELRLNRRFAPMLYVGLVKIVRVDGNLVVGGNGKALEWALEMVRFRADAQLDRIAAEGRLSAELVRDLGRAVAALHRRAPLRPDKGGAEAMAEVVRGNREDLDNAPTGVFAPADVDAVDRAACDALDRFRRMLDRRRGTGHVRHCHGDLHLGNLAVFRGRVVPFDCIEFNEDFACIDTVYDLAFLLMDLIDRDQPEAAQVVLQAWLTAEGDVEGLVLLPFFMAVRATIRAKVIAFAIADPSSEPEAVERARRYLTLAQDLLPPHAPILVAIGGWSGTGKSTLAQRLAPELLPVPGAIVLRSDVIRKHLEGVDSLTRLDPVAYDQDHNDHVYGALRDAARRLLRAGCSVVADAVHARAEERAAIEAVATAEGATFRGLWLEAPAECCCARVRARRGDASDANEAVVTAQFRSDPGPVDWQHLSAAGDTDTVVAAAQVAIGKC